MDRTAGVLPVAFYTRCGLQVHIGGYRMLPSEPRQVDVKESRMPAFPARVEGELLHGAEGIEPLEVFGAALL